MKKNYSELKKMIVKKNYSELNVSYVNKNADITISGTLTLPKVNRKHPIKYPTVILIADYGPYDRDSSYDYDIDLSCYNKKPFKTIAEDFAKKGIAVLRYDKRGVAESTGIYDTATSKEFKDDLNSGIEYLKTRPDINSNKIGLVGFSEGGLIALMEAN